MRQKDDLMYSELLKPLQRGKCNKYDLNTIHSRYFSKSKSDHLNLNNYLKELQCIKNDMFPFCVHDNNSMLKIVWVLFLTFQVIRTADIIL